MPDTLSLWHAEHVNFARLLDLLEVQLTAVHDGGVPDYETMLDIMYYMTHYPDVLHHPKEDLVFARIREREAGAAATVDRLTEQHASLRTSGNRLVGDLNSVLDGSIVPRERIESAAHAYVNAFREHMRIEESRILPLAARLLKQQDWAAIDGAIRHFEDPLFGARTEERYAALARHIAEHS